MADLSGGTTSTTMAELLKTHYLPRIIDFMRKGHPFLSFLERTPLTIQGSTTTQSARIEDAQGIGSGSEISPLPTPVGADYIRPAWTTKQQRAVIQVTEKAIQRSRQRFGSEAPAWKEAIDSIKRSFRRQISAYTLGDGTGALCQVNANETGNTDIGAGSALTGNQGPTGDHLLRRNMRVDLMDASDHTTVLNDSNVITARTATTATISAASAATAAGDYFVREDAVGYIPAGAQCIVDDADPVTGSYAGIARATYEEWKGLVASGATFTLAKLRALFDKVLEYNDEAPDMMLTRSAVEEIIATKMHPTYMRYEDVALGPKGLQVTYKALMFGDTPILKDSHIWANSLLMLKKDTWALGELAPLGFMDRDGNLIHRVAGYPAWGATLLWDIETVCSNPQANGKLESIAA